MEIKSKAIRLDVNSLTSERSGLSGLVEGAMRRFRSVFHGLVVLPLYGFACACVGAGLIPAFYLYQWNSQFSENFPQFLKFFSTGTTLAAGYFCYGFTLMFLLPAVNFVTRSNLKAWRGPYYSLEAIRWYIHNGATYLLRFTFLDFVTPSPFNNWFYQMMGMKIGRGTIINTTFISDPSLIEMGKKVTIGGSVTIVGHYGQGGYLVLAPVKIGDGATIGLKATIMGGVTIGKNAKILGNSVVLPNTVVPDGETWGGVPAQKYAVFHRAA